MPRDAPRPRLFLAFSSLSSPGRGADRSTAGLSRRRRAATEMTSMFLALLRVPSNPKTTISPHQTRTHKKKKQNGRTSPTVLVSSTGPQICFGLSSCVSLPFPSGPICAFFFFLVIICLLRIFVSFSFFVLPFFCPFSILHIYTRSII